LKSGLKTQTAPRRALKILKEVTVTEDDKSVTLKPGVGSRFSAMIGFDHPAIGNQSYSVEMLGGDFIPEISDARTFGFLHEVNALRAMGLALGGSLENAVVLDKAEILNPEGLRHDDEFARHKVLDAVGDIYIAGGPMIGLYDGVKPGHALNNKILRQLFADPAAFAWTYLYMDAVPVDDAQGFTPVVSANTDAVAALAS
jgi:UDP-3-O-[3-hydroxymyristoyl] N-acetylglucosamine deacetylase